MNGIGQEEAAKTLWVDDLTRYTAVHPRDVAVLFVDARPVAATDFRHDRLGAEDSKSFFGLQL